MNEQQRFLFLTSRNAIVKDLLVGDVFSYLQSKLVISYEDVERIKSEPTSKQKTEKLLDILVSKPKNIFNHFYDALKYAEYDHLAEFLEEAVEEEKNLDDDDEMTDSDDEEDLPSIETMLKDGGVPKSPQTLVERPECLAFLRSALHELQGNDGWVVLHGMAGSGKTILAASVLNDEELVHSCFPRGIFWVTIGQVDETRLLMKMQNLCAWLDVDQEHAIPKNLEEARDRLRILFAHDYPRSLLVLDDLWSDNDAKYFDVRVRTLVTTRYSVVAAKISGLVIKVPVSESLTLTQGKLILAKWTNIEMKDLPKEAGEIINSCKGSPLAISMIGALLKNHKNRWSYYLKQLESQKTSKVKSKLAYQYSSLFDALSVSFEDLPEDVKSSYEKFAIFEDDVPIPLGVLMVFLDQDEVETEDLMDELIDRSLASLNEHSEDTSYNIHDIQLSFLKEKAGEEGKLANFHAELVERFAQHCNKEFHSLDQNNYIHHYFILHLLHASKLELAANLLQDFHWIEKSTFVTGAAPLISSYKMLIRRLESDGVLQYHLAGLKDLCHLVSMQSHLIAKSMNIDFTQLSLSRPVSECIYKLGTHHAQMVLKRPCRSVASRKIYYDWINRPSRMATNLLLTSQLHNGPVNSCQFTHKEDSNLIVTSGSDKSIKLWNSLTGEEILTFEGHDDAVNYCEFSPNDEKIISCSADNSIKVWATDSGRELLSLQGHVSDVLCCKCSTDGKYIASASMDNFVKIWEMESGKLFGTLEGHTDVVNWCCFSPDGRKIASASNDLYLKIWSFKDKECLFTCGGDLDFIPYCLFTHDGERIISCSVNSVQAHSLTDGSVLWKLDTPSDILSMALSCDGTFLALAHNDTTARLFDLKNEVFVQLFSGHSSWLNDICFHASGKKIGTVSYDGVCKIWDVNPSTYSTERLQKVFDAVFDENNLPTVAVTTNKNQVKINVLAPSDSKGLVSSNTVAESAFFESKTSVCVLSHELEFIGVGFFDGTVKVMAKSNLDIKFSARKHMDKVTCLCFAQSDKTLVSGSDDGTCVVWNTIRGDMVSKFTSHAENITNCLFYDNDRKIMSASYDSYLQVWNPRTGESLFTCHDDDSDDAILASTISHNEKYIISCSSYKKCRVWSANDGLLIMKADDHNDTLRCVTCSFDNKMFAVGADDGTVTVWRFRESEPVCTCEPPDGDEMWVMDVMFNHTSDVIVTISNNIKWYNLKGDLLQTYHIIGSNLCSIKCTADLSMCVTIDDLGFLYVLKEIKLLDDLKT